MQKYLDVRKSLIQFGKMKVKSVNFSQLSDIMGFTILLNNIDDCYNVLGLLHQKYSYVPGRFKDYISTPKPNGYQSLHTTLIDQ